MGTSDGQVVGITKIVDHGDPSQRWNLVILSEGYQVAHVIHRFQDKELSWEEPAESLWNYCSKGVSALLLEASDGCQKTSTLRL